MTDHQPSNEIAVRRRDVDTWADVAPDVFHLADKIARTDFVPKGMRGNPPAVAAAILTGREMNLGPMAALRGLDVIDGGVSMRAEMIAARVLAAGHIVDWKESTDKACTVRIERSDGRSQAEVRYTIQDAQLAGLTKKRNWQTDPRSMLRARALSNAARMACPDVILGLDATDTHDDDQAAPAQSWTAVQVQQPTAAAEPVTVAEPTEPDSPAAPVTQAQLRKLNAQLGELAKVTGDKLDKDQRRAVILAAAGLDEGAVESATDLTRDQASTAIEELDARIQGESRPPTTGDASGADPDSVDVVDAEVVDDEAGEIDVPR